MTELDIQKVCIHYSETPSKIRVKYEKAVTIDSLIKFFKGYERDPSGCIELFLKELNGEE